MQALQSQSIEQDFFSLDPEITDEDQLLFVQRQFPKKKKEKTVKYNKVGPFQWRINFFGGEEQNLIIVRSLYVSLKMKKGNWEYKAFDD